MFKKIFIILILLLPILIGCGSGGSNSSDVLEVMIMDSATVPEDEGTLLENRWTSLVKEKMLEQGIKVDFKARGAGVTSHTIMMATGMAPDLAQTHSRTLFSKFAADGGLVDLGPYLDEYGVIDGKQYAIPAVPGNLIGKRYTALIRKDWLDILGMDVPENRGAAFRGPFQLFQSQFFQNSIAGCALN